MLYRKQIQGSECITNIGPVNPKEWRCRLRQQYKYLKANHSYLLRSGTNAPIEWDPKSDLFDPPPHPAPPPL